MRKTGDATVSMFTDEQQIHHVTSKVSMVETMHDGLRLALEGLRRDVKDGTKGNKPLCTNAALCS